MEGYDRERALAEAVAEWVAAGYAVESHSGHTVVLVQKAPTVGSGFARGGLIGMAFAAKKQRDAQRVTLYADETEVVRLA
jgi:hypothetical protein